jgi:hypothetical protein
MRSDATEFVLEGGVSTPRYTGTFRRRDSSASATRLWLVIARKALEKARTSQGSRSSE